jgi:hypothetical protein
MEAKPVVEERLGTLNNFLKEYGNSLISPAYNLSYLLLLISFGKRSLLFYRRYVAIWQVPRLY